MSVNTIIWRCPRNRRSVVLVMCAQREGPLLLGTDGPFRGPIKPTQTRFRCQSNDELLDLKTENPKTPRTLGLKSGARSPELSD